MWRSDYHGARGAGLHALLLRRPGGAGSGAHVAPEEDLAGVRVVRGLWEVVEWVRGRNAGGA